MPDEPTDICIIENKANECLLIYLLEAKKSFGKFIAKYRPDVAYVLFYQNNECI